VKFKQQALALAKATPVEQHPTMKSRTSKNRL